MPLIILIGLIKSDNCLRFFDEYRVFQLVKEVI